ncbi:FtsX-like permease family protein [Leucobacter sp. OH1287]|uniref:FtsX-like permease family protein n=1 Tax=Leucobacter sp. OH1287 TaxID=2491049 RepID=UPI000F5D8FC8|nr:ABC transporter permease [Leucobacter sp. OH1287]RRD61166.1 ABC transporter permease [Leucobacter sp. OH1287]
MFLAIRELRFAQGRFSLIVTVVALMTMLVGFLTGLTGGLASQNISALLRTGADQVVFSAPTADKKLSYSESAISADAVATWEEVEGVRVTPLSIVNGAVVSDSAKQPLVFFAGVDPEGEAVTRGSDVILGEGAAAELGVTVGDTVTLAGSPLTVTEITGDEFYSHREVAWISLESAHQLQQRTMQDAGFASVLLLKQTATGSAQAAGETGEAGSAQAATGIQADTETLIADTAQLTETEAQPLLISLLALESFKSEIGSLGMMIGMLVVIATLVIGVFFLVWSMQRYRDIAVLKALGAKTSWLVRDSLGQALLVLVLGVLLGGVANLLLGSAVSLSLPFVSGLIPVALPAVMIVVAGLIGALVSLRQVVRADPNSALQAAAA